VPTPLSLYQRMGPDRESVGLQMAYRREDANCCFTALSKLARDRHDDHVFAGAGKHQQ